MRRLFVLLLVLMVLAGAAHYLGYTRPLIKSSVESALLQSGMSDERADCMADRMVDRLSLGQLWNLRQSMAAREGEPEQADSFGELVKRLRRTDDFETVSVITTSAGLCAIGIG